MAQRRIVPLLVAFAVAFAPAALAACHASCLGHGPAAGGEVAPGIHDDSPHGRHVAPTANAANHIHHAATASSHEATGAHPAPVPVHSEFAITTGSHICGHSEDLPVVSSAAQAALAAPVLAEALLEPPQDDVRLLPAPANVGTRFSDRLALIAQLRV